MEIEVTNTLNHGLWIFINEKELFLSYENFPWFKNKTINDIIKVKGNEQGHLYWENLNIDLSLEMIEYPERFPLISNIK